MSGITLAVVAHIPPAGVAAFQAYEDTVLRLLGAHDGTLERRLRNVDGTLEVHVVRFASPAAFEAFRADPERTAVADLLEQSGAQVEATHVTDV
ncbi:MAG: hypothetical protein R3D67_19105 [Hyphomicrobiaceae bacterium]